MVEAIAVPAAALARIAALGIDVAPFLFATGIDAKSGADLSLAPAQFSAFCRALEDAAPFEDLGLQLGAGAGMHRYDVASMAALDAPTLGAALDKYVRYKRLCCPEHVTVRVEHREARIRSHWTLVEEDPPSLLLGVSFAAILAFARTGTGAHLAPVRVELARRRANAAALARHFDCPIRFDAPLDLMVFPERALAAPFVKQDVSTIARMLPGLNEQLSVERTSFVKEARLALLRRISGEVPSLAKLATDLGVSTRTLQRRLGEMGTSYQRLLDDVRATVAQRLLVHTDLAANEIAFVLGYEELNSFSRAFHGWHGTTPSRYRAARARGGISIP